MLLWYFFRILCRTRNQIAFLLGKPSLYTTKTTHGPRNIYWRNSRAARLEVGYNVGRELTSPGYYHFKQSIKPVLQQVSCVNTNFWLDNFTQESRHTRDLRHLLQTFAKGR